MDSGEEAGGERDWRGGQPDRRRDGRQARRPVLIILHQDRSTPGHVGRLLAAMGHPLDVRRPRYGDPLPATMAGHAGSVIFGGPMSANDADDYVKQEIALIELSLKEQVPFLGICLGAQMMAVCLGGKVAKHPDGHVEQGYYDVEPLAGATIGGAWPTRVYQWHSEGFDVPAGAEALARAAGPFPNQALRYGPADIGLQFHPEITYAMAARWSGLSELKLPDRRGARLRPEHLADHMTAAPVVQRWLGEFLEDWLALRGEAGEAARGCTR